MTEELKQELALLKAKLKEANDNNCLDERLLPEAERIQEIEEILKHE